jgi:hypothetical protein
MKLFRRKYFIYPEIQTPMLKLGLITMLVMSIFQITAFFLVMKWIEKKTQVDMTILVDYRVFGLWRNFIIVAIVAPIVFNILVSICITLYISNKFAGPIFRIEKEIDTYLNQSAADTKQPLNIKLRQNDYLKSLANKINSLSK